MIYTVPLLFILMWTPLQGVAGPFFGCFSSSDDSISYYETHTMVRNPYEGSSTVKNAPPQGIRIKKSDFDQAVTEGDLGPIQNGEDFSKVFHPLCKGALNKMWLPGLYKKLLNDPWAKIIMVRDQDTGNLEGVAIYRDLGGKIGGEMAEYYLELLCSSSEKKGIGSFLLGKVEEGLLQEGKTVSILTLEPVETALGFYQKMEFQKHKKQQGKMRMRKLFVQENEKTYIEVLPLNTKRSPSRVRSKDYKGWLKTWK